MFLQFVILCMVCIFPLCAATTLKERLQKAQVGSYVITAQGGHHSLLLIRSLTNTQLILEEITFPSALNPGDWKKWMAQKAPGHTSWFIYTYDLEASRLVRCYSPLLKQENYLDPNDYFFARLLTLPLSPVKEADRKRIGPSPVPGETDHRKLWLPPVIRFNQKLPSSTLQVLQTRWPQDESRLAGCTLELYLDSDFPFPYWLEIQSPHYNFKLQVLDSGTLNLSN